MSFSILDKNVAFATFVFDDNSLYSIENNFNEEVKLF